MATHAIERAARCYVSTPCSVVLRLVPTNTIRLQTHDALLMPGHPYREALLAYWPADRLAVIDITDCAQQRVQDFGNKTIVIVGTRQTLQVKNTASRDVYAYKEDFEPHFSGVADEPYLERVVVLVMIILPLYTRGHRCGQDLTKLQRQEMHAMPIPHRHRSKPKCH